MITILTHISLAFIQPGYVHDNGKVEFMRLLETFDASLLCPDC